MPFLAESLGAVQRLINAALTTDETSRSALVGLQGARLGFSCTAPALRVLLKIDDGQIRLSPWHESDEVPQVSLSGKAVDMARMLIRMADQGSADLSGSGIRVEGDVGLLLTLSRAMAKLDIDWEDLLAKLVGEKPAHFVFMGLAEVRKAAPGLDEKATAQGSAVVEQMGLLQGKDVEAMRQQIRQLQYRVDRLHARMRNLETES